MIEVNMNAASSTDDDLAVLRTYQGSDGDVDVGHPTLKDAIAAFHAAPVNANPRVIRAGRTLVELDRRLMPVFIGAEAQRIHRELVPEFVLRTFAGFGKGDVDAAHPTLEAAMASFVAAPSQSIPRVVRDGMTVAQLDPEAGLAPVFRDGEAQRIYWRIVNQGGREHESSEP